MAVNLDHNDIPPEAEPAAELADKKRQKSGGEVVFDRVAYTGIGFGMNEISTLVFVDQFLYGKNLLAGAPGFLKSIGSWFSKEGYDSASKWLAKVFKVKDVFKDGKRIPAQARAGNGLLMVTLLSGGTLLLLPMKRLEDHKVYWVKKANHLIDWLRGHKFSEEDVVARDKKVEQDIACSPRQSWPSMLLGRAATCVTSVGVGTFLIGPDNNKKIMDFSENLLAGSVQLEGCKSRWHRYASLIGVETYSCLLGSIVLEITSKLLAKRSMRIHDPELCKAGTAPLAVPSTTAGGTSDAPTDTTHAAKIKAQKECASCALSA